MKDKKNCSICLYNDICVERKEDVTITDCCIPEKPLRVLQKEANTLNKFIYVTHDYIKNVKIKSKYWIKAVYN